MGNAVERLVEAIVALGETLGLESVAEGVEELEELEALRSIGCRAWLRASISPSPCPSRSSKATFPASSALPSFKPSLARFSLLHSVPRRV